MEIIITLIGFVAFVGIVIGAVKLKEYFSVPPHIRYARQGREPKKKKLKRNYKND